MGITCICWYATRPKHVHKHVVGVFELFPWLWSCWLLCLFGYRSIRYYYTMTRLCIGVTPYLSLLFLGNRSFFCCWTDGYSVHYDLHTQSCKNTRRLRSTSPTLHLTPNREKFYVQLAGFVFRGYLAASCIQSFPVPKFCSSWRILVSHVIYGYPSTASVTFTFKGTSSLSS